MDKLMSNKWTKIGMIGIVFALLISIVYIVIEDKYYKESADAKRILKEYGDLEDDSRYNGSLSYNKKEDLFIFTFSESQRSILRYEGGISEVTDTSMDTDSLAYTSTKEALDSINHLSHIISLKYDKEITIKVKSPTDGDSSYIYETTDGNVKYNSF